MNEKQDILLTIIIPVHNRAELLKRTVESIVAQTYRPFNLIIVDNNSSDNTLAIANALAQQHTDAELRMSVMSEQQPGATAARNRGLSAVTTKWTMFFDSDDTMSPNHVERAMATAKANPEAQIVGWDTVMIMLNGAHRNALFEVRNIAYNSLFHGTFATQRYMAHTALFRSVGGWNTNVPIWNDIELGARLLQQNPVIVKAKGEPTVTIYAQSTSISGESFGSRIDKYQPALDSIKSNSRHKHWVELKKVIIGATIVREGNAQGKRIYHEALQSTPCPWHRLLWRLAYGYTSRGGRGIARIYKFLHLL